MKNNQSSTKRKKISYTKKCPKCGIELPILGWGDVQGFGPCSNCISKKKSQSSSNNSAVPSNSLCPICHNGLTFFEKKWRCITCGYVYEGELPKRSQKNILNPVSIIIKSKPITEKMLSEELKLKEEQISRLIPRADITVGQKEEEITTDELNLVNENVSSVSILFNKGIALMKQGDTDKAIQTFDAALEIDPTKTDRWNNRWRALNRCVGCPKDVKVAYEKIWKKSPEYVEILRKSAIELYNNGNYQEAINNYNLVIKIIPTDLNSWLNKGIALNSLGKFIDATQAFDQVLKIDPNHSRAKKSRSHALSKLTDREILMYNLKIYNKLLKNNPNDLNALCEKGIILNKLEKYMESIQAFDDVLKIDPDCHKAISNKDIALSKLKLNNLNTLFPKVKSQQKRKIDSKVEKSSGKSPIWTRFREKLQSKD